MKRAISVSLQAGDSTLLATGTLGLLQGTVDERVIIGLTTNDTKPFLRLV